MNAKKMKIRKNINEFHEYYNILKGLILKEDIVVSFKKYLTFYINMKETNKIEFEEYINDIIYLPDKSIALSFNSNIKILKKIKNKYETYKIIDIKSFSLLNNENILYAFNNNSLNLININDYTLILSVELNKNITLEGEMKPFFLKEKNDYNICIRKNYSLYLLDSRTYKKINELSFNDDIDFTVTQKEGEKDKFYVCIFKDWEKKENKMDIEIREYNNKFRIIHKYNKILYTPPVTESLYPVHLCIHELLIINNKFYIFMHSYAEFQRSDFNNHYILDFESNKIKSIFMFYKNEDLYYKFLLNNNKLLLAYFYNNDEEDSKGVEIEIIDYENMDYESENDYDDNYEEGEKNEISDNDLNDNNDNINESDEDEEEEGEQDGKNDDYNSEENISEESEEDKKKKIENKKKNKHNKKILGKKTKSKSN